MQKRKALVTEVNMQKKKKKIRHAVFPDNQ